MKRKRVKRSYNGVDAFTVLNGMVGTIAMSIKASGGDDSDVAEVFRSVAESYERRAEAPPKATAR